MPYIRFSCPPPSTPALQPFLQALAEHQGWLLACSAEVLQFAVPHTEVDWAQGQGQMDTEELDFVPPVAAQRLILQGAVSWPLISALTQSMVSYQAAVELKVLTEHARGAVVTMSMTDATAQHKATLLAVAESFGVDMQCVSQLPTLQRPGLLVMDMDSTAITIECIDEIAHLAGVGEQVAAITEQAMQGALDFGQSLRARVATLTGADEQIMATVRQQLPLMPGLQFMVDQLHAHGWKVAIASGGFTYFADHLKSLLPLDAAVANEMGIANGQLTGEVVGQIVDAEVKANTLSELAQRWNIAPEQTIAIGDGANDLKMMKRAALGIAFHAKPIVNQQVPCAIRHGGLEQVIYMLQAAQQA